MDHDAINDYATAIQNGAVMPPVLVFRDSDMLWLVDGFLRCAAALLAGQNTVRAIVRVGTKRDAALAAAGANTKHGLRRTNDDKRRVVQRLLDDPEWSQWNDSEIGRHCDVSNHTVAKWRAAHLGTFQDGTQRTSRRVRRGGTTYQMRPRRPAPAPAVDSEPPELHTLFAEVVEDPIMEPEVRPDAEEPVDGEADSLPLVRAKEAVQMLGDTDRQRFKEWWLYELEA
jgi:hypothetical protein